MSPHTICERHGRGNITRHIEDKQNEIPKDLATRIGCLVYGSEDGAADAVTEARTRFAGLVDYEFLNFDIAYTEFKKAIRDISVYHSHSSSPQCTC